MRFARAFTLIEILIALTIFSIVAVLCALGLHQIILAKTEIAEHETDLRHLQLATLIINRDIMTAIDRPILDNNGKREAAFLLQLLPQQELTFTSAGLQTSWEFHRQSPWQRIRYQLNAGNLTREVWSSVDRQANTTSIVRTLLSDVSSLTIHAMDSDQHWLETWPAYNHPEQTLPRAVNIALCFKTRGCINLENWLPANSWNAGWSQYE